MVLTLTVTIGMDDVDVGMMVGVSVGNGVLLGNSVAAGWLLWAINVRANAVAVSAISVSGVPVPGSWEGRLQADNPRMRMRPTVKIFLLKFIVLSRVR